MIFSVARATRRRGRHECG